MISNDSLKESEEKGAACNAMGHQEDKNEIEADNDFEDSSWDPYCETIENLGMDESHFIDTLIDVSGCQTGENNNIGSGPASSTGTVSLDFDDITLGVFAKFRDDLFIDTQFGDKYERGFLLRKTKSCPSTPLRTICNEQ